MKLALITVPYASTGLMTGEARAPAVLRAHALLQALQHGGNDVLDLGDVSFAAPNPDRDPRSGIIAPRTLTEMTMTVRHRVAEALTEDRFPIVIGGECPLLLGCLAALRDLTASPGLVFVDGHEDAWPPHRSTTGEAADMELGLALGLSRPDGLDEVNTLLPLLRPNDVVMIGPRDRQEIEDGGVRSLAERVAVFADDQLLGGDPYEIGRNAAARFSEIGRQWWLHLDLDVLSSEGFRAVRYPQAGGLSWDDLEQLVSGALGQSRPVGFNLTIYNPDLDPDGSGAARIIRFLETFVRHLTQSVSAP